MGFPRLGTLPVSFVPFGLFKLRARLRLLRLRLLPPYYNLFSQFAVGSLDLKTLVFRPPLIFRSFDPGLWTCFVFRSFGPGL